MVGRLTGWLGWGCDGGFFLFHYLRIFVCRHSVYYQMWWLIASAVACRSQVLSCINVVLITWCFPSLTSNLVRCAGDVCFRWCWFFRDVDRSFWQRGYFLKSCYCVILRWNSMWLSGLVMEGLAPFKFYTVLFLTLRFLYWLMHLAWLATNFMVGITMCLLST